MSHFWAGFIVSLFSSIVSTIPDLFRGSSFCRYALSFFEWLPTTLVLGFLGGVIGEFLLSQNHNYSDSVFITLISLIVAFCITVILSKKLVFLETLWNSSRVFATHVLSTSGFLVAIIVATYPFFHCAHLTNLSFSNDWISTFFSIVFLTVLYSVFWRASIHSEREALKPRVAFLFRRACSQSVLDLSDPLVLLSEDRENFKSLQGGLEKRRTFISNLRPGSFFSRHPPIYNVSLIPQQDFQEIVEGVQSELLEEIEIWNRMFSALDGEIAEAEEAFTVLRRTFTCSELERIAFRRLQLRNCSVLKRQAEVFRREDEGSSRK